MTASIYFAVTTVLLSLFKSSMAQFCPFPNFNLVNSVCVWILNDPAVIANKLFSNIPYNTTLAHRTIDTLIYGFKNDGLLDYFKNSGIPYPTSVDIIEELTAIRNQSFPSDWEFQQAVSRSMAKLHDAHSKYNKPACYSSNTIPTLIQLPFNFIVNIGTSTGRLVYQLDTRTDSSNKFLFFRAVLPDLTAELVKHFAEEIVLIDDLPTDVALSAFSDIMGGLGTVSNDPSVLKNIAINSWTNQNVLYSNAPLKNEIKLTFSSGKSITIPYLMIRPASAKPFSISECIKQPSTPLPAASATVKGLKINPELKEEHPKISVEYLEHIRLHPKLKEIDDMREVVDLQMVTNGNFITVHNTSNKLNDIPCFATSDESGRSVLIIEIFSFAPKVTCTLFRNSLKTCLSQPYDYVIINTIGNTGGVVTLGYMTIQLLVESAFNNPTSLYNIYDLKHSETFDLLVEKGINIPDFGNLINPKTLRKFDNFSHFYNPGRKVFQGGVVSLRSNQAYFPVGPSPETSCTWSDITWKPAKFYNKFNLFILTDGTTGSTGATFSKTLHERNMATFIGMGGNWGDDIDIGSYAGGAIFEYSRLVTDFSKFTFLTQTTWNYPVLIAYSKINNDHPQQFHKNAAQIRLAKWNTDMNSGDNKVDLYKSAMALVPPTLTQSPTVMSTATPTISNFVNIPNCNNDNNYSNMQVILIGVLPVCLLFLLVTVPLLVYIYLNQSKKISLTKSPSVNYENIHHDNTTTEKINQYSDDHIVISDVNNSQTVV